RSRRSASRKAPTVVTRATGSPAPRSPRTAATRAAVVVLPFVPVTPTRWSSLSSGGGAGNIVGPWWVRPRCPPSRTAWTGEVLQREADSATVQGAVDAFADAGEDRLAPRGEHTVQVELTGCDLERRAGAHQGGAGRRGVRILAGV